MLKFLEKSAVIAVIIVVITQTFIFFRTDRENLTEGYNVKGLPLENENYTFKTGELEILLTEPSPGDEVIVFVNGVEVSNFSENTVKLGVKENDVIELVNYSITNNIIKGKVVDVPDYFDRNFLNINFESDSGRVTVGRVFAK